MFCQQLLVALDFFLTVRYTTRKGRLIMGDSTLLFQVCYSSEEFTDSIPPRFCKCVVACIYGDPHIVTLDGFKYTFNGFGEYILIETPDESFTLQGRMVVPSGGNLPPGILATVFTAIVAREGLSRSS